MKRILIILIALLLLSTPVLAAGDYALSWWTVDGGGATFSAGGSYNLGGSIGQADAGAMSGGGYTLNGGFWAGAVNADNGGGSDTTQIFLPIVLK